MKRNICVPIHFFLLLIFLNAHAQKNVQTIDAFAFSNELAKIPDAQLIDIRTAKEFTNDHLENAENIDWNDSNFNKLIQTKNKNQPIFLYCETGKKSIEAAKKIASMGFKTIYNLNGGILKWHENGFGKQETKNTNMSNQDLENLLENHPKILIVYYAEWCPTCQKMAPIIQDLKKQYEAIVKIVKINIDENETLSMSEKITSLPTMRFYKNKKIEWQRSGSVSSQKLEAIITAE